MKYQIELRSQQTDGWRQYTTHNTYISAWLSAFRGRIWTNFLLWLNGRKDRIEIRIIEVEDET